MARLRFFSLLLLVVLTISNGCNKGLEPPALSLVASISGRVHFGPHWPRRDSVRALELVLVQPAAPFADSTLIRGLNTTVLPLAALNYLSRDTNYAYSGIKPGTYNYLGVAQLFDTDIYHNWRVVGFAHDNKDSALVFVLHPGEEIVNADVFVNFDSLPRQPFIK